MSDTPIFITLTFILIGVFVFSWLYTAQTSELPVLYSMPSINLEIPQVCQGLVNQTNATNVSVVGVVVNPVYATATLMQTFNNWLVRFATSAVSGSTAIFQNQINRFLCTFEMIFYYLSFIPKVIIWILQVFFALIGNIIIIFSLGIVALSKLPVYFNLFFVIPVSLFWGWLFFRLIRGQS